MGTPALRPVVDLVERRTGTVPQRVRRSCFEGLSPVLAVAWARVPSSTGRKVFLSGDYEEEQLCLEFLNDPCLTIRHLDLVIRTFLGPFFTALGWDVNEALDTVSPKNGEVSLFPPLFPL